METLFTNLPEREIAPVLIVMTVMTTGLLTVATIVISLHWRRLKERQIAAMLVQDMLERGMGSDDICQVMASAGTKSRAVAQAYRPSSAPPAHYAERGYHPAHVG